MLVLIPASLLLFQMFWEAPFDKPRQFQKAIEVLMPPMGIIFRYFDFNEKNALAKWEEKIFQGRVAYWIDFSDSEGFLHSKSAQTASAIFYRAKFSVKQFPYVSWKWRVGKFPDKSKTTDPKKRDDFAARFYVVFVARFFTNFQCIEYVWDESLPEGTILTSPYTDKIKQIVAQSGPSKTDEWVQETRNIFQDYKDLFGKPPKMKASAIAVMTNASGTQTEAEGFFDDIQIGAHSDMSGANIKI